MDTAISPHVEERSRSVEDLEGFVWPPSALQSYVVRTSDALRRKPLHDLTNEELRVGLEQQVGVRYLVPLALERLQVDPLLEARLYRGDLLISALEVLAEYWRRNREVRDWALELSERARNAATTCSVSWQEQIAPALREARRRFGGILPSRPWLRADDGAAAPPPNNSPGMRAA